MHMLDGLTYLMGSMKNLERITEASNENDMIHDYCSGLHYALVESGGFLRNGLGPTSDTQFTPDREQFSKAGKQWYTVNS